MGKKDTDKKLGRFSTILEIITNLGQIFTWILGVGSAYVLNIQTKPIVVPGFDITLDLGFQFALLISAMLGYIHFLQKFWEKNFEKLNLSDSFLDFSFWDLPRLRQPLLLIPLVIALAVFVQVTIKSPWLLMIFIALIITLCAFTVIRFRYHLSPARDYVKLAEKWENDTEWLEKWSRRIKKQLSLKVGVVESDLYESGIPKTETSRVEITFAMHKYFEKYEFEEDLTLMRVKDLYSLHPLHKYESYDWVLLPRKNLDLVRSNRQ